MSKYLVTVAGVVGLFIPAVTEDGRLVIPAMLKDFEDKAGKAQAEIASDWDSVETELMAYLLASPGLRTIASESLIRGLHETRLESGFYVHHETTVTEKDANGVETERKVAARPFTREEKDAAYDRLGELVRSFVKSRPSQFHTGKRSGIAVRFVAGESVKGPDGVDLYDADGNKVQAYRHTADEWTKITTPKAKGDSAPVSVK